MMAGRIIYLVFIVPMMAMGAVIVLRSLGAFGSIPTSPDGPAWLGLLVGLVFLAGSSCALIKIIFGGDNLGDNGLPQSAPLVVRVVYGGLGYSIVAGLAALFTWIGFGPGERQFTGSGAFLGV